MASWYSLYYTYIKHLYKAFKVENYFYQDHHPTKKRAAEPKNNPDQVIYLTLAKQKTPTIHIILMQIKENEVLDTM